MYESQIVWKEKFQNIKLAHCSFTVKHSRFIKFLFKFHTWVLHSYMANWPINSNDTLHPLQLDPIQSKKEAGCPAAPRSCWKLASASNVDIKRRSPSSCPSSQNKQFDTSIFCRLVYFLSHFLWQGRCLYLFIFCPFQACWNFFWQDLFQHAELA